MRIARFILDDEPSYGVVAGEAISVITGDPLYTRVQATGQQVPLDDVRLLAPVIPRSKVVGFYRSYRPAEADAEIPDHPLMFLVPNTAVCGPDDPIVLPDWSDEVVHEAELAVVISRMCKDVPVERAQDVVLGYTCANDVSARDAQRSDGQWARAKGFDSACPLGPWIETDLDPDDLRVTARLDGVTVQDGTTADLIWPVAELIAHASRSFTLLPGDVLLTGTPAGAGPLTHGQRVEVEVEGVGTLGNPVLRR